MLFQDATIVNGMVRSKDSMQEDNYTYKGIEYERKDLWEKLKQEGKTKRFFTLSEKEKLGKDGQYIIYQAPSGELFAVTRDTNDYIPSGNKEEKINKLKARINMYKKSWELTKEQENELAEMIKQLKKIQSTADIKFNETPDSEFDKDELALGIKTEMEHTDNKEEAESIAKDHLQEDEKYYTKLVKMEAKDAMGTVLAYKGYVIYEIGNNLIVREGSSLGNQLAFYSGGATEENLNKAQKEIDKQIKKK